MSTSAQEIRRRLIVELCHGAADARTLRTVAEMAALLRLDLHGLFVEDEALLSLAELPFARELRLPTREWERIDAGRIAAELRRSAADAQRLLREIAASLGVPNAFEVRRGDPAETIAAVAMATDVVAIATPTALGGWAPHGAARMQTAVHESAASLLLLPAGFTPRHGRVVALVTDSEDPALALAARVAANTHEHLLVLLPEGDAALAASVQQRAATLGLPKALVERRGLGGLQVEDLLHTLGHTRERLVVLTRKASAAGDIGAAWRIATDRGVAVLLVERGT